MPDTREMLMELLYDSNVRCDQGIEHLADDIADVIAHGVTIQRWVPVTERLPEKQRDCLCFCNIDGYTKYPFCMVLRYHLVDEKPHFQHECEYGLRVTHWMPLPQPPKGE